VVVQFALSLILANAGLLLIQSYASLRAADQGFDGEHTMTMALTLDGPAYDENQERAVFFQELLPRLDAIPGVRASGVTSKLPLRGGTNGPAVSEAMWNEDPENRGILTEITYLDGDYFEAMGIPFLAGRPLGPEDADAEAPGVVINEAAASRFWPGENPLGKRLGFTGNPPNWTTVVGVVGNVRQWNPGSAPRPELYAHYNLRPRNRMLIVLNAEGDPNELVAGARSAVGGVDPLLPLSEISTMGEILEQDLAGRESLTTLIGILSILALVLAAAGLYGVISYFVARRTHELGVRLALGADRSRLVGMVVRKALALVALGLVVGAGGLWLSTRILASLLFGVGPLDPPTIIGCVVLLVVVGVGAALLPGLRATRLSPVNALRVE
jgi:predicted permease